MYGENLLYKIAVTCKKTVNMFKIQVVDTTNLGYNICDNILIKL